MAYKKISSFYMLFSFITCLVLVECVRKDFAIIAHRGASGYLPEHTMENKAVSLIMNADYIEQDVLLSKDNVPIVLHDIYIDDVTNVADVFPNRNRSDSRYYAIDFDYDELVSLKVSERFKHKQSNSPTFPKRFPLWQSRFRIHSFEEEIELIQGMQKSFNAIYSLDKTKKLSKNRVFNVGIYVEIKNPEFHKKEGKGNMSEIVLNILNKYNYSKKTDKAIIQCFDPAELKRIKVELKSNLTLVQLLEKAQSSDGVEWTSRKGLEKIKEFADGIGPEKDQLLEIKGKQVKPSELYKNAKELGLFMHPYTFRIDSLPSYVDDYYQLLKIFIDDLQVDGLFTDFSDLTLQFVINSNETSVYFNENFLANMASFFLILILNNFFLNFKFNNFYPKNRQSSHN